MARYLSALHSAWQGYAFKYKIAVDYDDESPVDIGTHSGKRILSSDPDKPRKS